MTLNSSTVAPSPASSTSSSTTGVASNASRLRENQRRSRARKKEYLLSLEARFQACQRTGIEANIDIQNAAKKVVRENHILRSMLRRRGVTDDEIDRTLKEGGEEGSVNGESAVEGVLKVLGRRPCGSGPIIGGTGMQCKPTKASERVTTERRNSTGMVAARDADRGGGRGAGTESPALAVATSKLQSQSLSPQPYTPPNYPTPTPTPMAAPVLTYTLPPSPAHMNGFYSYGMSSPPPQPSHTAPTISSQSPTYTSYQMSPSMSAPSNSCCSQPQTPFYSTTQSQCSPSPVAVSSSCCSPQRPVYPINVSSSSGCSYQTNTTSTTPCHLAQSFINQLHQGLPGENTGHLIDEICPPEMMEGGQCHVDNAVLFGVLDRI